MHTTDKHKKEVVTYYNDTGLDYREWSRALNMHFGYYKFRMNPFRREPMLDKMNDEVYTNLNLQDDDKLIYDLGCGLAATCRSFARKFPNKKIIGITIVPSQVKHANEINKKAGLNNIEIILGDYTVLPFADNSADAVYALESCCHCEGLDKAAFINEMMRVLKPGKTFVIADGFIKKDPKQFGPLVRYCYKKIIKGWALPSFPHLQNVKNHLQKQGAVNIEIKDISYRIAPSVLHAPFTVTFFLIKKMFRGEKLNAVRTGHLKACLLGLILGLHNNKFSYCMIKGIKKR